MLETPQEGVTAPKEQPTTPKEQPTTPKDESTTPKVRRRRAASNDTKVYEDATYGKYVKATDFGLDTTGKV